MREFRAWLRSLLTLENIIDAVGIIVAAFLAYQGIVSGSQEQTLGAIIALLTALALAQIVIRQKSRAMEGNVSELLGQMRAISSANIRLEARRDLEANLGETFRYVSEDFWKEPHCVYINGLTLLGALATSQGFLKRVTKHKKSTLRCLIVHPNSEAVRSAAGFLEKQEVRETNISSAIAQLKGICEEAECVEAKVKLTSVAPPFSLVIIDPDKPTGVIQVEIYGRGIEAEDRPHFLLTKQMHPDWHTFFNSQFDKLWEEAEELADFEKAQEEGKKQAEKDPVTLE